LVLIKGIGGGITEEDKVLEREEPPRGELGESVSDIF
jgi:hypothetical protein